MAVERRTSAARSRWPLCLGEATFAAEHEKRVEHTKEMALRRIGKRDLTRGWVAWFEVFDERRRGVNMLKNAAARLTRPKLVQLMRAWKDSWEAKQASVARLTVEGRMREEIRELKQELAEARQAMLLQRVANGPGAMSKYANDPEIMSVVKELQSIIG